jgi:hypothetical protein
MALNHVFIVVKPYHEVAVFFVLYLIILLNKTYCVKILLFFCVKYNFTAYKIGVYQNCEHIKYYV